MKVNINKLLFGFIHTALSIMIALLVLYAAVLVGTKAYDFGYRVFTEPAVDEEPGDDKTVTVTDGLTSRELGALLQEKGLVENGDLFAVQLELSVYSMKEKSGKKQILPGSYVLNTSMTARDMMAVMSEVPEAETESTENAGESDTVEEITVSSEE